MSDCNGEIERLRRAFDAMPKDPSHGETALDRHRGIRPEWVMQIIADPYDRYVDTRPGSEPKTIIVGRVPESRRWIRVVFLGDPETGLFLTAYHDHRLEDDYGGRPWEIQ